MELVVVGAALTLRIASRKPPEASISPLLTGSEADHTKMEESTFKENKTEKRLNIFLYRVTIQKNNPYQII
jgi:hypothetical protein